MTPSRTPPPTNPENHDTGSPLSGEPVFLAVGQLRRAHGVQGEIILEILTDFPERVKPGLQVYAGTARTPLRIRTVRPHDEFLLISFEGFFNRDEVGAWRNQVIYIQADRLPELPEGEYYHHQLLGLRVVDENGSALGKLAEILETGANDVYVVRAEDGAETLLPAIEAVVLQVDLEKGEIRVRPPEWS